MPLVKNKNAYYLSSRWGKSDKQICLPPFCDSSLISSLRYSRRPSKISRRFLIDSLSPLTTFSPANTQPSQHYSQYSSHLLLKKKGDCIARFCIPLQDGKIYGHAAQNKVTWWWNFLPSQVDPSESYACMQQRIIVALFLYIHMTQSLLLSGEKMFYYTCNVWETDLKVIQGQWINHRLNVMDVILLTAWRCNVI